MCTVYNNYVEVSGFTEVAAGDTAKVIVKGVKHPNITGTSGFFEISTKNTAGRIIDLNNAVAGVTYTDSWAVRVFNLL